MLITTEFDIGDTVKVGSGITGRITRIYIGIGITYEVTYWNEINSFTYVAYSWELTFVESIKPRDN